MSVGVPAMKLSRIFLFPLLAMLSVALLSLGMTAAPSRSADNVSLKEFPLPGVFEPYVIANGPDGNMWFTDREGDQLGKLVSGTGQVTLYPLATDARPWGIAAGPDGNVWFTENRGNRIGKINPTTGAISHYDLAADAQPWEIVAGPDGNMWFTEFSGNKIGKINPTTGAISTTSLAVGYRPSGIAVGPDRHLWFTSVDTSKIGKHVPATGATTYYDLGTGSIGAYGITAGSGNSLWFTVPQLNKIGRITVAGQVSLADVPSATSQPLQITTRANGEAWFTEASVGKVASAVDLSNPIQEYAIPNSPARTIGITTDAQGDIWFTTLRPQGAGLGRFTVTPIAPPAPGAQPAADPLPTISIPGKVTGLKIKWNKKKRKLIARWGASPNADKYQVRISKHYKLKTRAKKIKKFRAWQSISKNKHAFNKIKKKKKYKIEVRGTAKDVEGDKKVKYFKTR